MGMMSLSSLTLHLNYGKIATVNAAPIAKPEGESNVKIILQRRGKMRIRMKARL